MFVHIFCTCGDNREMTYEEKAALARTGDYSKEAVAVRLRAARNAAGLSQAELGKAARNSKAAISNAEQALSYPGRPVLIYLYREHRIDLNFIVCGDFVQLPGDVQDRLFAALSGAIRGSDRSQG
ncbi:helix-turn-helix domain-containing protein [Roseovarius amoyensis]|uniref:helix-turn-helix domain-containing protein n=1 Tax=Roseovarius amoyensis TaxID=2211448 RepID=UPI001EF95C42|nr:helix-turn-helix transcriptional regulator [Roseovarius amoyensis]